MYKVYFYRTIENSSMYLSIRALQTPEIQPSLAGFSEFAMNAKMI